MSREHLSRLESGKQEPGTEALCRLARTAGVSLDVLLLGACTAEASAAEGADWVSALEPLLGGTGVRLPRGSAAAERRVDRAWQELAPERKEEIRALVRRVALVALALEGLLPARTVTPVVDELSAALASALADRILARPRS
jgi:transcriptional regulator with XRE-family HTH domain